MIEQQDPPSKYSKGAEERAKRELRDTQERPEKAKQVVILAEPKSEIERTLCHWKIEDYLPLHLTPGVLSHKH